MENELLTELEQKIGYQFKDKGLLKHAMSHSSYANERHMGKLKSNERLEFLGDAVLELVTSEYLFHTYPTMPEGDATKMRASIVCEQTLAFCAKAIPLGDYILLGRGEEISGGRTRASITSDTASTTGDSASSSNGNVSSMISAKRGINCSPSGTISTSRLLFNPSNTDPISLYLISLICCIAPAVS